MERVSETGEAADFGFRKVGLGEKQRLVDDVFHSVARRYDLMNDLMSLGLHRAWKSQMVTRLAAPKGNRPFKLLDVAGGTGDIAFRVLDDAGEATSATILDINREMLGVGAERAAARHDAERLAFVQANAEDLPFPDRSFDGYTIAFGIRNVPRIEKALAEAYRVLKPGGRILVLEFSHVDVPGLDRIYETYSFRVIPELGRMVAGDRESYQYLVESIRRFPKPAMFAEMMREAGFERVSFERMTGGIVALHGGWRF